MTTHSHRILIGASGWIHPDWEQSFYPEDLPADWQLGFYSNEFPVVLMPAAYWQAHAEEIDGWLDDSHDELMIIAELPEACLQGSTDTMLGAIDEFVNGLSVLSDHVGGLLVPVAKCNDDVLACLSQLSCTFPVCVDPAKTIEAEALISIQKVCQAKAYGLCWRGSGDPDGLAYGSLALSRIDAGGQDMREIREKVETILNTTKLEQTSVLIIEGMPPDISAMRNAGVILDLI